MSPKNEVRDYVHALLFFVVLVASWVGLFALLSCGTPLAPKEVCVQWQRVTPDGGLEPLDGDPLDGIVVVERRDAGTE